MVPERLPGPSAAADEIPHPTDEDLSVGTPRDRGHPHTVPRLFLYAVCEFFDDGVGEDFFCDALDLGAGSVCCEAFS